MLSLIDCVLDKTFDADGGLCAFARENPGVHYRDELGGVRKPEKLVQNKHVGKRKSLTQGRFKRS